MHANVTVKVQQRNVATALKRFKKKCFPVLAEVKRRDYHLSPMERRRGKQARAEIKAKKRAMRLGL